MGIHHVVAIASAVVMHEFATILAHFFSQTAWPKVNRCTAPAAEGAVKTPVDTVDIAQIAIERQDLCRPGDRLSLFIVGCKKV